jgi:DNA-binding response OmpR family regulator/general stress protein YciG
MHAIHKGSGSKRDVTAQLDGRGRRVLIADTDPAVSIDLAEALRQVKFTVDCAKDRATRLKMLASEGTYDVVILDLLVTGYGFFDELKQRYPERQPHIILITSAPRRNIARIPPHTVCVAMLKPFERDRCIAILTKCIDEGPRTQKARHIELIEPEKVARPRRPKKFVLVVDTDLKLCHSYVDLLQCYGFAVTYVSTPDAAREYLPRVELLILELMLGAESGFALLDELRREHSSLLGRTLIITSASLEPLNRVLGDIPVLEKPFHVAELLDLAGLITAYPIERSLGEEWEAQLPKLIASNARDTKHGEPHGKFTSDRPTGFARLDAATVREVASKGGRAAHAQGRAHEFTPETAAIAGKKGGENVSRDRAHMAAIGREGAHARAAKSRTKKRG